MSVTRLFAARSHDPVQRCRLDLREISTRTSRLPCGEKGSPLLDARMIPQLPAHCQTISKKNDRLFADFLSVSDTCRVSARMLAVVCGLFRSFSNQALRIGGLYFDFRQIMRSRQAFFRTRTRCGATLTVPVIFSPVRRSV